MDSTTYAYEQLIERFVKWAQTEQDIRAAMIIGSRARIDHPADEWSDLDIVIIAMDAKRYWSTANWIENIGKPWLTFVEQAAGGGGMERRVLFARLTNDEASYGSKADWMLILHLFP